MIALPRVLVVAPRLDLGGAETHLVRVLPRLRAAGLDVSLFTIARGGRLEPALAASGVPVFGCEAKGSRALDSLRAAFALRRLLRGLRPDLVHCFLPEPYLIGGLAAAGIRGPIRVMSRRSLDDYQRGHPWLARLERRLHASTDALLGNSSAVAAQLAAECGDPDKVGLIHNGIDAGPPSDRAALRRELGIPPEAFVIVMVANLIAYKGHADLLAGLARVKQRIAEPWRLLLIGRDEGQLPVLKTQADALGLGANVQWLGERGDARALLPAADIGVLASHQEGFSNSLIEKMAAGLPTVATRVGGNTDAVSDGTTGVLVPPCDPAALGEAIALLHEDPALRARMGAAARQRVEAQFSLEACVGRYLSLYRGLAERRAAPVSALIELPQAAPGPVQAAPMAL